MKLQRVDPRDDQAVTESLALAEAARGVDTPWSPPQTRRAFVASLVHGWDGEPGEQWLYRNSDGQVVGRLSLHFPQRDNTHMASLEVLVHPGERRKGHGTALLTEGLERVRQAGRRLAIAGTVAEPGASAFAERHGFTRASVEVQRRQDLSTVDHARIAELREAARQAASDYTLLRFVGAVPDDLVDDVAALTAAMNDAPTDDYEIEDEVYDAKRIRAFEAAQEAAGTRLYRLVARLGNGGPLAGHTIVGVPEDLPGWAWQFDTAVAREHRGHRLGLLLKAEMVAWLQEAEPDVRRIDTWNAESNAHMIAVNEQLGYRIWARYYGWQRRL
ncbi:MAG TPA: GNAT family N-acetyltransferase [Actinopolymorphaceae bacterium]